MKNMLFLIAIFIALVLAKWLEEILPCCSKHENEQLAEGLTPEDFKQTSFDFSLYGWKDDKNSNENSSQASDFTFGDGSKFK